MNNSLQKKVRLHTIIGLIVCATILLGGYFVHTNLNKNHTLVLQIEKTLGEITYYDEILTMSARMAAFTGDSAWESRYRTYETKLDNAIKLAEQYAPEGNAQKGNKETEAANIALIKMEDKAFQLVTKRKLHTAQRVLLSNQYKEQKALYAHGQQILRSELKAYKKMLEKRQLLLILMTDIISILGIIFIISSVFISLRSIQKSQEQERIALEFRKMAIVGKLSAGMAHEINNALQPIMGLSDILSRAFTNTTGKEAEFAQYAKIINKSAKHASEIVENVLASVKGTQSQLEKWDALDLFSHALSLATAALPESIKIENNLATAHFTDQDIKIVVNKTDTTQIVTNLIKNAAHAMENTGTIAISTQKRALGKDMANNHDIKTGEYLALIIKDNGCGMDEKTLSNIFDPFYTTKGEQGGTGLGLSIAYGIMKNIGGTILVQSKPGKGSSFSLLFPMSPQT